MRLVTWIAALMLTGVGVCAAATQPLTVQMASFGNGVSSTGWIGFDFANGKSILVPAKINGRNVFVKLIDGADTSYIDRDFAASLGLAPAASAKEPAARVEVQVQLGSLSLRGIKASVMTLGTARAGDPSVPFILSDALFNQAIVDIDFANHRIAFEDPRNAIQPPPGAVKIPLVKWLDSLTVPVSVDGNAPVPFEWYLGDPAPITVYQPYFEAHGLLQHGPRSIRLGGGLGGQRPQEAIATLNRIQFAGVDFQSVPGVFPSNAVRGSDSPLISGNIGLALLSRFRLVIDYPHRQIYAAPYAATEPFARDRLGLYLSKGNESLAVDFVSPDSPAQSAGFRAGDEIAAINQKPSQAWSTDQLAELGVASNGSIIMFTMKAGGVRKVEARDYF